MATSAFFSWVSDGSPHTLSVPVAQYKAQLVAHEFAIGNVGTIGDPDHLQADPPQDHTPFSVTGWPRPSEYPYVHALDLSGTSRKGLSWRDVAWHWIREARARKTPWVKYITIDQKRYDVRNDWEPVPASGHTEHVHVSIRTDWTHRSIGGWNVMPQKGFDMFTAQVAGDGTIHSSNGVRRRAHPDGRTPFELRNAGIPHIMVDSEEELGYLAGPPDTPDVPAVVDPLALAQALASQEAFVDALATAVAAKLGMVPTAGEIARQVGALTWHGRGE